MPPANQPIEPMKPIQRFKFTLLNLRQQQRSVFNRGDHNDPNDLNGLNDLNELL